MSGRLTSLILLTVALFAAGCKPAPKTSRAATQEPPQPAVQTSAVSLQPDANDIPLMPETPAVDAVPISASDANSPSTTNKPKPAPVEPPGKTVPADSNQPAQPTALAAGEPNDFGSSFNSKFEQILNIYVNSEGSVDYTRLRRMRLLFTPLLQELDRLAPEEYDSWPQSEKIAFWINTYNVCLLKVVADNYPIKASVYKMVLYPANSVMQIDRAWSDYRFSVMGVPYSLSEIEQRILLNQFTEPRIAFALCYASKWSPRLLNRPYYGAILDAQLDRQTREYIASEKGFRIDKNTSTVYLSVVFKDTRFYPGFVEKYGSDHRFNDDRPETRAMLNFISMYLDRADVDYLTGKKYTVTSIKPDWSLNE